MDDEKYFVGSYGDAPEKLYFDLDVAMKDKPYFIDAFNSDGDPVSFYELEKLGMYTRTPRN